MIKFITRILPLFLISSAHFVLSALEPELVVRLETESSLTPISMPDMKNNRSGFSDHYASQLDKILRFDFQNNGKTKILAQEEKGAQYVIEAEVKGHCLNVSVESGSGDDSFHFTDIRLSGYLDEDRKLLHQVADTVHEALFGTCGIASSRLLFTIREKVAGKEASEIWQSDYDGANAHQVTNHSGYAVTPAYIPPKPGFRSGSFVFVSYITGQPKIHIASLKDGVGRQLMTLAGNQLMPTLSRQRDQIAFISDVTGNPDLFLQDFDPERGPIGKPRHLYTARFATQGTPTFSPDGTRIAFVSDKSGTPRIYVMKIPPPGTPLKEIQPVLISKFTRGNTAPSWSPDGTKIAYCSKIDGVRQIMVYDFLTGLERRLTDGKQNKENPVWAPNSLHLVYNTSDMGNCQLYLINLKQPHATQITFGPGEKRFPSFEPRSSY